MTLRRRGDIGLPAIRGQYDDADYPRADSRALSRIDVLEDRLSYQEKTTQALIDRAFKIKEDIIDSLNLTHGTWQEEKQARGLLQEHIRTITDVVKTLSRDILVLEQHIQARGGAVDGTANAVKTLELQQVASLTDLRGRVARCDASLAKLAADLKMCYDGTKSVLQSQQDFSSKITDRLQNLDSRFAELSMKLERSSMEQSMKLHHIEGDSSQQLATLDNKTRSLVEGLKNSLATMRVTEEAQRDKMEQHIMVTLRKYTEEQNSKQEKFEARTEEMLSTMKMKISSLEDELLKEKEKNLQAYQALSSKLHSSIESQMRKQTEETQRLKRECREGFSTIHQSISNMKEVNDGKRKLLEEQLRKEISQIRKMVVLV